MTESYGVPDQVFDRARELAEELGGGDTVRIGAIMHGYTNGHVISRTMDTDIFETAVLAKNAPQGSNFLIDQLRGTEDFMLGAMIAAYEDRKMRNIFPSPTLQSV